MKLLLVHMLIHLPGGGLVTCPLRDPAVMTPGHPGSGIPTDNGDAAQRETG